ncbi:fimbrial protein [Klebsiella aerogenes]|uniref:fimbrial protein n=1 Tax=Klebsiella aerogenes TaxID=548 RepID=UPI002FFA0CA1
MMILGALVVVARADAASTPATLTVTGPVQDATCNISIPQVNAEGAPLMLGRFAEEDFTQHNGTAAVQAFQVRVDNCTGTSSSRPALRATGAVLTGNDRVFNDTPGGTSGFMVRAEKYTGTLADFYSTTDAAVVRNGAETYDNSHDLVADGVLDYTVGFVTPPGNTPAAGDVKASITFEFHYH